MRLLRIGVLLCIAMASSVAFAKPKPQPVLPQVGPWEINYDRDSCHLLAKFGEGEQLVVANFTRYAPGDHFNLTLYGKPVKLDGLENEATIDFGTTTAPIKVYGLSGNAAKLPMFVLSSLRLDGWKGSSSLAVPPPITADQEARAVKVGLSFKDGHGFELDTGSMRKPMAALRTCLSNLLKNWGYDAAVEAQLMTHPLPFGSPGNWLRSSDYPRSALAQGISGLIQFRLDIDESGLVSGCNILSRTGPDEFAAQTCKNIQRRARFHPAIDAQGKPVKSFYINAVRWLAP